MAYCHQLESVDTLDASDLNLPRGRDGDGQMSFPKRVAGNPRNSNLLHDCLAMAQIEHKLSVEPGPVAFHTTHWSVVMAAQGGEAPQATKALESLCCAYWYPLYAFIRRQGRSHADAQELTQGFFAHLLARDFLRAVSQENGRFRSFLLAAVRHFLSDQRDKERALKRGGGQPLLSLDARDAEARYRLEPTDLDSPDRLYERRWALTLLERALARLREEFASGGREELFAVLRQFQGDEPSPATGAEAAARLGMPENTFKSHVRRFRQRYRELLCAEVAQTVATPGDVAEELQYLKKIFSA